MIISPCAMLITPITPNVIASPTAASSNTEPRLKPKNKVSNPVDSFLLNEPDLDFVTRGFLEANL